MSPRLRRTNKRREDPNRKKYLLRNVHPNKMDVSLSDLRYRIPKGQVRDLLSPNSGLMPEDVEASRKDGSIAKRLRQKFLIEVMGTPDLSPPFMSVAEPSAITFPQRTKSLLIVDVTDVSAEIESSIIADDDDLLRELDRDESAKTDDSSGKDKDKETTEGGIPLIADSDDKDPNGSAS